MTKIAVLMPSRGVLAGKTMEAVLRALRGYQHDIFWTHGLPLPECFNALSKRVLDGDYTHGLFAEEDVVIPENALALMLEVNTDITAINYEIRVPHTPEGRRPLSSYYYMGELLWLSLGCTLIRREVFEKMPAPWFEVDKHIVAINDGSKPNGWRLGTRPRDPKEYGGQDSYFCYKALQLGFTLGEVPDVLCEHLPSICSEEVTNPCVN